MQLVYLYSTNYMQFISPSILKRAFIFLLFFSTFSLHAKAPGLNSTQILEKMFEAIQDVQNVRYTLHISERVKGVTHNAVSDIKLNTSPRKLYLRNPKKGTEILWVQGENKGECWIYPNGFPYATLNLSPMGDIMRKNQHHTIHDLGFGYIAKTTRSSIFKSGLPLEKIFTYIGDVVWDNTECYKLFASYQDFKIIPYKVEKGETVASVANEFNCGEYRILERNEWITNYNQNIEGKTIMVPNNYSNKTIMYINKKSNLPVFLKVYDDLGFYEGYEYHNLIVNGGIDAKEFTKEYKGYKF